MFRKFHLQDNLTVTHLLASDHSLTVQNLKHAFFLLHNFFSYCMSSETDPAEQRTAALADEDVFYLRRGEEALNEALEIVESKDGWKPEMAEVIVFELKHFPGVQFARTCSHSE